MNILKTNEDGYEFWLRYRAITDPKRLQLYQEQYSSISYSSSHDVIHTAAKELAFGLASMLGKKVPIAKGVVHSGNILLMDSEQVSEGLSSGRVSTLAEGGYVIYTTEIDSHHVTVIQGKGATGVLYGVFKLLSMIQTDKDMSNLEIVDSPVNKLRMVNMWDNPRGDVERGYAGDSILYENDELRNTPERFVDFARMMSSTGINGIAINNVNTSVSGLTGWKLLSTDGLRDMAVPLANIFRKHGITTFLSVDFASPMIDGLGPLETANPADPEVIEWWCEKANEIYSLIPDFGGFVVKADSEGQPGPYSYGCNHAHGANLLANALKSHGGHVFWRAFVYGHSETDRAAQPYEQFMELEGQFADNVILQVKNGPMDFQVREPVSPLLGAMAKTNQMLEFQITQEYTGFDTHLCYLIPMWKEVLNFDTFAKGEGSTVEKVISGELFGHPISGIAAVHNIGRSRNWTGHYMAQANSYGFGRLAWNPKLSAEEITDEWVKMSFGSDPEVVDTISRVLLNSWRTYEDYTCPMGVGFMCHGNHYDPSPEIRAKNYHKANASGVGYDRSSSTGSNYVGQYFSPNREAYNSPELCPEELLLFMHHLPYTHKLKNGTTLIQHIYNSRYNGLSRLESAVSDWRDLVGKIDHERHQHVLDKLNKQFEHAIVWRDSIYNYFLKLSGIPDKIDRA